MAAEDDDLDDVTVAIDFQVATPEAAHEIATLFSGEDVSRSNAFGGRELVTIITKLGSATIEKLIAYFARKGQASPKTSFTIGKSKIALTGYTAKEIQELLESPGFRTAVRAVKKSK